MFQPMPEIIRDFYAEVPFKLKVTGSFHEVATFFDRVGKLYRIVNIRNISMSDPTERSGKIVLTIEHWYVRVMVTIIALGVVYLIAIVPAELSELGSENLSQYRTLDSKISDHALQLDTQVFSLSMSLVDIPRLDHRHFLRCD